MELFIMAFATSAAFAHSSSKCSLRLARHATLRLPTKSSKQPTSEMSAFVIGIDTYTFISCTFPANANERAVSPLVSLVKLSLLRRTAFWKRK